MKKRLTLIIIASFLLFQGASPWEGSAAVAPNGDLPSTGFYIATNAFPKNTVVDITNIENGKQTRVIVSNNLTSPGLLAVVSREAAELIGMRAGSVSRIRMIQPSDPMAYMRFTEKMEVETPDYDSGDVITEEKLTEEVYKDDTYTPPAETGAVAVAQTEAQTQVPAAQTQTQTQTPAQTQAQTSTQVQVPQTPPEAPPKTSAAATTPGYVVDEPEWGGNGRLQIVDVPGYMVDPVDTVEKNDKVEPVEPAKQVTEEPSVAQVQPVGETEPVEETKIDESNVVEEPAIVEPEKEAEIAQATEEPQEPSQVVAVTETPKVEEKPVVEETPPREVVKDVPEFITETPRNEVVKDAPEFITEAPRNEVVKEVSPWQEKVEVVAAPVTQPEPETQEQPQQEEQKQPEQQELTLVETTENPPQSNVLDMFPEDFISGIGNAAPEKTEEPKNENPPSVVNTTLSVRTIDRLDRGKYYVQVAALSGDLVENTLNKIDRSFAPVVFKGADNLYRILIGPLNQGESAAILVRFKSIGYKDAFVRKGS